jgi:hypothetical protein
VFGTGVEGHTEGSLDGNHVTRNQGGGEQSPHSENILQASLAVAWVRGSFIRSCLGKGSLLFLSRSLTILLSANPSSRTPSHVSPMDQGCLLKISWPHQD